MNILHRIRRRSGGLSRVNLALFALVWLSIVVAPCAMAMQVDVPAPAHDCPHCPPQPCHETEPQDCDAPDSLDSLRLVDKTETITLLPPQTVAPALFDAADTTHAAIVSVPPVRAGPRPHLVNAQFNE
ncbi:MAG TPA: hypothetical protein VJ902_09710 [Wenzhouxiangellaceae bacterium]|nr:hypothetical protein [Wenzhouxiangellaceae bacterium]